MWNAIGYLVLVGAFFLEIALVFGGAILALMSFPWRGPREGRLWTSLLSLAPPIAIYAWIRIWKAPSGHGRYDWVLAVPGVLLLVSLALAASLTWRLHGHRRFAAGVGMATFGLSLFLMVPAIMAIEGQYILG